MNIKTLRRNYEQLTMLERLSLADNAEARDDENEIRAINAASPKEPYRQVDFYNLMQEITIFRLCNMIARLGYIMLFDFFLESDFEDEERLSNDARFVAYLYVRTTDSWKAVNDEIGLRPDFDAETAEYLFSIVMLKRKDNLLRNFAFTETEAREFSKVKTGSGEIKTLEDEIRDIREVLNLPPKT